MIDQSEEPVTIVNPPAASTPALKKKEKQIRIIVGQGEEEKPAEAGDPTTSALHRGADEDTYNRYALDASGPKNRTIGGADEFMTEADYASFEADMGIQVPQP
jgi:hypothetical protein